MSLIIYVGVDGGGTKSKIRVENAEGMLLGQSIAGPANLRLSTKGAWESILTGISEILKLHHLSLEDKQLEIHAGLALAGCEVREAREKFLATVHPFQTLELMSDAHAACVGAHEGKDGAIIIAGTGVIGYQILCGETSRVSGWGFPHDDIGGGAWLGLEATRLTFEWLDNRAEKSPLAEDVFAFFNHDMHHFVAWANDANATEFARLAPLVINHAQQEEIAAVRLLKKAAHAIDRVAHALTKMRPDEIKQFPCSFMGGIAPFLEPWLQEEVRDNLTPRHADASAGALLIIKNKVKAACSLLT